VLRVLRPPFAQATLAAKHAVWTFRAARDRSPPRTASQQAVASVRSVNPVGKQVRRVRLFAIQLEADKTTQILTQNSAALSLNVNANA